MKDPFSNEDTVDIPSGTRVPGLSRGTRGRWAGGETSLAAPEHRAVSHRGPAGSCALCRREHTGNRDVSILPLRGVESMQSSDPAARCAKVPDALCRPHRSLKQTLQFCVPALSL